MITTEFFKTLKEAECFQHCGCVAVVVCGLDKRGTAKEFNSWLNDAIASERKGLEGVRAVVVMYR